MTTLAAPLLSDAQQMLIDARLDTIDRMLMGRVTRADRMAIVHEVESQIQELLAERDPAVTSREDILEVLRRLDPPEAYLQDESEAEERPRAPRRVATPMAAPTKPAGSQLGRLGGILGLCSFGLLFSFPVIYVLVAMLESEIFAIFVFPVTTLLGFGLGIAGLALSIRGRREGVLPILGIIASAISMPIYLVAICYGILIFISML